MREDLSDVLLIMDQLIKDGFEPEQFIQGLADHMRDLLVCKDSRTIGLLDVSDGLKERYQHQAALTSKSVLLTGLDILNQCDIALPRSKNKRLYTEIALSKINFANRAIEANLMSPAVSPEKKTKFVNEQQPKTSGFSNTDTKPRQNLVSPPQQTESVKPPEPPIQNQVEKVCDSKERIWI